MDEIRPAKRSWRWDGEQLVEVTPPAPPVRYEDVVAAEWAEERRRAEARERLAHPGNYV